MALPVRQQSKAWCWCVCLGLALMLSGVVVGGAYLYRYYILEVRLDHSDPCVYLGVIEYCNWQDWNVVFIVFEYMICLEFLFDMAKDTFCSKGRAPCSEKWEYKCILCPPGGQGVCVWGKVPRGGHCELP